MKNSKITVLFSFHDGNKNNGGNRSLIDVIDNLLEKKNIEILAAFPVKEGSAIEYLKSKNVYIVPFCYGRWDYHMEDYTPKNLYCQAFSGKLFLFYAFQNFRFRGINAVRQNDGTVAVGFDFSAPGIFYGKDCALNVRMDAAVFKRKIGLLRGAVDQL